MEAGISMLTVPRPRELGGQLPCHDLGRWRIGAMNGIANHPSRQLRGGDILESVANFGVPSSLAGGDI